ncbi:MAG: TetR/AcrR family transcriptional regulator [Polyangiaceae bacterium]
MVKPKDEAKAREILAATLHEVAAHGLASLSIEAVAKRAGVATGTVYVYHKGKEALLDALYLATKKELASAVFESTADLPVRVAFERTCVAYVDYLTTHREAVSFMQQMLRSSFVSAETRAEAQAVAAPLAALLERGKREALLKNLETPFMIAFLTGTVDELSRYLETLPPKSRRAQRDAIAQLCWDALKA